MDERHAERSEASCRVREQIPRCPLNDNVQHFPLAVIRSKGMQPSDPLQPAPATPDPELAVWEFAGLLLTYWCNASCAFCYVYSSPDRGGRMSVADALEMWRGLDRLAAERGKKMRIHLSGGEAFGDWPRLLSIIRAARDAGLTPLEKIETNAFWATSEGVTRTRLEQLDALGMELLVVSTDVYHQEFVPFDRVKRCVEVAREVLGRGRVRVRWWDFFNEPLDPRELDRTERRQAYAQALARHKDRITGRAADQLADLLPRKRAEHFRGQNCVKEVLHSRHVHIDPYGNVFPGVCNGIILGNALKKSPEELWDNLSANWRDHPVVATVVAGGSHELTQRAKQFGYEELEVGYANKCHLCHHVRRFLHEHCIWPEHIGPAECYANERNPSNP
jgi:MoaA/NifB/PqqE/SkfB family radical SAM enzyme